MTSRENFEKWWDGYFHEINGQKETAFSAWKACTALHEAVIVAKDKEKEKVTTEWLSLESKYAYKITALELDNKRLREALEDLLIDTKDGVREIETMDRCDKALSTPPSTKALDEYWNQAVEECADVVKSDADRMDKDWQEYINSKPQGSSTNLSAIAKSYVDEILKLKKEV